MEHSVHEPLDTNGLLFSGKAYSHGVVLALKDACWFRKERSTRGGCRPRHPSMVQAGRVRTVKHGQTNWLGAHGVSSSGLVPGLGALSQGQYTSQQGRCMGVHTRCQVPLAISHKPSQTCPDQLEPGGMSSKHGETYLVKHCQTWSAMANPGNA